MAEELGIENLLRLARDKSAAGRAALLSTLTDLFGGGEEELSPRERTLMAEILRHLVHEVEVSVRRELADRLSILGNAPPGLIVALANDTIEVAHSILLQSPLLHDLELIEVIRHRTLEHQLAIAMREEVSEPVSDALVETGSEDVITTLLGNLGASISDSTLEQLVAESKSVERYREPIVKREDLPPRLARRMYWWVSAALREHILEHYDIDPTDLDDPIVEAVEAIAPGGHERDAQTIDKLAALADELVKDRDITPDFLVRLLRQGKIAFFEVLFARHIGLRLQLARRILYEPGGEAMAIACRATGIGKPVFASIFLLSRQARPGDKLVEPGEVSTVLAFYDRLGMENARRVLQRWRLDPEYLNAIRILDEAGPDDSVES